MSWESGTSTVAQVRQDLMDKITAWFNTRDNEPAYVAEIAAGIGMEEHQVNYLRSKFKAFLVPVNKKRTGRDAAKVKYRLNNGDEIL